MFSGSWRLSYLVSSTWLVFMASADAELVLSCFFISRFFNRAETKAAVSIVTYFDNSL